MNLFTIPWRHIREKWLRSIMLIAVFTLGVASMVGLYQLSGLIAENFEKKLVRYGANILVTPKQEALKISYGGFTLGDVAIQDAPIGLSTALAAVGEIPLRENIALIAPKLLAATRLSGESIGLVGVDWNKELELKGYWKIEGAFPDADAPAHALAGSAFARRFGLRSGQTLEIGGQTLLVTGILRSAGNDDDHVLFASLPFVQRLTGKPDQASFLEVAALCSGCPIDDLVAQLQKALPGTEVNALRQVVESRMYAVEFSRNLAFSVCLVILVTACAMLLMSMLSAVAERRKEIGVLRAVGFSRGRVFLLFVSEALAIGLLAGVMSYGIGQLLALSVLEQLQLTENPGLSFNLAQFAGTSLFAGTFAGLAAAFPAWKASLVEPAEALSSL